MRKMEQPETIFEPLPKSKQKIQPEQQYNPEVQTKSEEQSKTLLRLAPRENKDREMRKVVCRGMQCKPSRWLKPLIELDRQISQNFNNAHIQTRPVDSNGLWCCLLIPAILISYHCTQKVSPVYKLAAYVSFGQLCYSLLFIVFVYISCLVLRESLSAGCVVSTLLAILPTYYLSDFGLLVSLLFSSIAIYPYYYLIKSALVLCPRTFTVGEAMIVSQGTTLFLIVALADLITGKQVPIDGNIDEDMTFVKTYIYTVFSTVGLIVTALYFLKGRRDINTLAYLVSSGAVYALIVLHYNRGMGCIPEFIKYILMDRTRGKLILFWLFLVAVTVAILVVRTKMSTKATTATRKTFHILASIVFLSGILNDVYFTILAAAIMFGVMMLIEALRLLKIEPISSFLQAAFDVYSDEKDSGVFAVTPIYLYVGLACPLILVPWKTGAELELFSGVLSIGVGDTAASWFGARYGINKWPNGNRTMEGTAFNICTQMMAVYALGIFNLITSRNYLSRSLVAAVISGLVEARVNQVDNLILPLVTILAFQSTFFLA